MVILSRKRQILGGELIVLYIRKPDSFKRSEKVRHESKKDILNL